MNFLTIDLNLLRVFDVIMTEQNLTRAADKLAMTQPAVSNSLRRLRDCLEDDLLVRTSRGMRPTPRAEELWPTVRLALSALESALAPQKLDMSNSSATFRLAMADSTAGLLLPPIMKAMKLHAPNVDLRCVQLSNRDPRPLLLAGEVDLAIGSFPAVVAHLKTEHADASPIRHQGLYSGKPVCIMARSNPLADVELTLERYCAALHALVSFSGRASGPVDEILGRLNKRRRIALTVNQFSTAFRVVANSDLLAVVPRHLLESTEYSAALTTKTLPFELPTVHVDMFWHERNTRQPAQIWLRDLISHVPIASLHDGASANDTTHPVPPDSGM